MAILTPATFNEDAFTQILNYLAPSNTENSPEHSAETRPSIPSGHDSPHLRELVVNTSCTNENNAPILTQITGLSKLSIHSPTRAILDLLPDWLRRLSDSLTELHLTVRTFPPLFLFFLPVGLNFNFSPLLHSPPPAFFSSFPFLNEPCLLLSLFPFPFLSLLFFLLVLMFDGMN